MGRMTYVQRRANRYEFRFRLPEQLAGKKAPANLPFDTEAAHEFPDGTLQTRDRSYAAHH